MERYLDYVRETLIECFKKIKEIDYSTIRKAVSLNRFGDQTFEIDIIAENLILEVTKSYFKNATLVSEESEIVKIGIGGPPFIVIDPIDGSVNAARGYPCYSSSIAVAEGENLSDIVCSGVINLIDGSIYLAEKNHGAFLNGRNIRVSDIERIEEALIAVDLNIRSKIPGYIKKISGVVEKAKHVRFLGTDALEICMVASGAADAFIDLRGFLRSLDFAAASLIVKEAGGLVLDERGEDLNVKLIPVSKSPIVAVSSKKLAEEIFSNIFLY
ncbi:MAG: inositol monophosphatase family protein [Nitrososphaerota archaeon]|nr:inositol monophosphatase family protein [Nitrososphaerota archaeon]